MNTIHARLHYRTAVMAVSLLSKFKLARSCVSNVHENKIITYHTVSRVSQLHFDFYKCDIRAVTTRERRHARGE